MAVGLTRHAPASGRRGRSAPILPLAPAAGPGRRASGAERKVANDNAELHTELHIGRSGDEPLHARSPLRLRLGLTGVGMADAIAGIVLFTVVDVPAMVGVFAALAVLAVVDAVVIVRVRQQHLCPTRICQDRP